MKSKPLFLIVFFIFLRFYSQAEIVEMLVKTHYDRSGKEIGISKIVCSNITKEAQKNLIEKGYKIVKEKKPVHTKLKTIFGENYFKDGQNFKFIQQGVPGLGSDRFHGLKLNSPNYVYNTTSDIELELQDLKDQIRDQENQKEWYRVKLKSLARSIKSNPTKSKIKEYNKSMKRYLDL